MMRRSPLEAHDWIALARRTWREHRGRLVPDYDVEARAPAAHANLSGPRRCGTSSTRSPASALIVRGANSDMLAATTLEAMLARRARLDVAIVADQGHALAGRSPADPADRRLRGHRAMRPRAMRAHLLRGDVLAG